MWRSSPLSSRRLRDRRAPSSPLPGSPVGRCGRQGYPVRLRSMGAERLFWRRARWRLRGAWQWPAFIGLTLADGVLLARLPFTGGGTHGVVPGVLIAGFANLLAVAVLAPLLGRRLRRRRPDLPKLVASDYAGTFVLVAI